LDLGVKKVMLISSDKAVSPINLYGATKMVAEKIFVQSNSYAAGKNSALSVVRYGNVMASRGSVLPTFLEQSKKGLLTVTDERMTRFWITLEQGVNFVIKSLDTMRGGEIFVPKIPSVKIMDLARAVAPKAKIKIVGLRPGEKMHEILISLDEARHSLDFGDHFVVLPEFVSWGKIDYQKFGKVLDEGFYYSSDNNGMWLETGDIKKLLSQLG
jgi:UDP-N-acetylglucosamine 4,6-dehydratase